MRRVQRLDDAHRVRRTVEEIGIAERDVLARRRRPAPRCRRARRPAARRGTARRRPARPDNAGRGAGSRGSPRCSRRSARVPSPQLQRRVARQRRQAGAVGHEELQTRDAVRAFGVRRSASTTGRASVERRGRPSNDRRDAPRDRRQLLFELAAEHVVHAERAQPVARSAARTARRRRSARRDCWRARARMTGAASRVAVCIGRWNADRDRPATSVVGVEPLLRDIDAGDVDPFAAQPGRRRREAEGLAAQVVGRNQKRTHRHRVRSF